MRDSRNLYQRFISWRETDRNEIVELSCGWTSFNDADS